MGDTDHGNMWLAALNGLTFDQLMAGMSKCANSGDAWPPSAPEFKAMCKPNPADYGLPGLEQAYKECCNNSHQPVKHQWSHNAIYQAGRETGWYEIRNAGSKAQVSETKKSFVQAYERACSVIMAGGDISGPEVVENALEHHQNGEKATTEENRKAQAKAMRELRGISDE